MACGSSLVVLVASALELCHLGKQGYVVAD